ncbi:unnamed protein product, partial [Citrullus colocynthis]
MPATCRTYKLCGQELDGLHFPMFGSSLPHLGSALDHLYQDGTKATSPAHCVRAARRAPVTP